MKWDDLKCNIKDRKIRKMSKDCLKFNREYKLGQTLNDYLVNGDEMVEIQSIDALRSIYDQTPWLNFYQVLFPKKI